MAGAVLSACAPDDNVRPDGRQRAHSGAVRVVVGSVSALDWMTWLGQLSCVAAIPQHAARYANGLPEGFLDPSAPLPQFAKFRAEALLAHEPQLVVCDGYQNAFTVRALRRAGVAVCVLKNLRDFASLEANARLVVEALRAAGLSTLEVAPTIARLRGQREAVHEGASSKAVSVLPYYDLGGKVSTAGIGTSEDLLLTLAGLENHARTLGLRGHASTPIERVLERQPDWILVSQGPQRAGLMARPRFGKLAAVRAGRVLELPPRLRQANSPYVIEAARTLRRQLVERSKGGKRSGRAR